MNLIRYQFPTFTRCSPLNRLASFRDEIDRLFAAGPPARESSSSGGWNPTLDVYDEKDRFIVSVELPGVQKDQIDLSYQDGVLTISGERKPEREGKEGETFRSERYFGKFQRTVNLPASVDATKINATYQDGVLRIDLPKAEEAKPKHIQVNVS